MHRSPNVNTIYLHSLLFWEACRCAGTNGNILNRPHQVIMEFTFFTRKGYFPNLLEITLLHQIFVYWVRDFKLWLLAYFFNFLWLCKVSERLDNIYIRHFTMVPPLNFWWITKRKNIKGGTIVKCLISMLSNLSETLHSQRK